MASLPLRRSQRVVPHTMPRLTNFNNDPDYNPSQTDPSPPTHRAPPKHPRGRRTLRHSASTPSVGMSTTHGDGSSHKGGNVIRHNQLRRYSACSACRRRRTKCDAAKPHCGACVRHHQYRNRRNSLSASKVEDCGCVYEGEGAEWSGRRRRFSSVSASASPLVMESSLPTTGYGERGTMGGVGHVAMSRRESQLSSVGGLTTPSEWADELGLGISIASNRAGEVLDSWGFWGDKESFGDSQESLGAQAFYQPPAVIPSSISVPTQTFHQPLPGPSLGQCTTPQSYDFAPNSSTSVRPRFESNSSYDSNLSYDASSADFFTGFTSSNCPASTQPPPNFGYDTGARDSSATWGTAWSAEVSYPTFIPPQHSSIELGQLHRGLRLRHSAPASHQYSLRGPANFLPHEQQQNLPAPNWGACKEEPIDPPSTFSPITLNNSWRADQYTSLNLGDPFSVAAPSWGVAPSAGAPPQAPLDMAMTASLAWQSSMYGQGVVRAVSADGMALNNSSAGMVDDGSAHPRLSEQMEAIGMAPGPLSSEQLLGIMQVLGGGALAGHGGQV